MPASPTTLQPATTLAMSLANQPATRGAVLVVALLGVVLVAVLVLVLLRRKLFADEQGGAGDAPLSLTGLRELRDRGELSEEEYAKAAAVIKKMSPGSNPLRDEIEKRQRERFDSDNDGDATKRGRIG